MGAFEVNSPGGFRAAQSCWMQALPAAPSGPKCPDLVHDAAAGPSGPLCSTHARPTTKVSAVRAASILYSTPPLPPAHCMPRARSRWPPVARGAQRRTQKNSCRRCRSSPLMGSSTRSLERRRCATNIKARKQISAPRPQPATSVAACCIQPACHTSSRKHS